MPVASQKMVKLVDMLYVVQSNSNFRRYSTTENGTAIISAQKILCFYHRY